MVWGEYGQAGGDMAGLFHGLHPCDSAQAMLELTVGFDEATKVLRVLRLL